MLQVECIIMQSVADGMEENLIKCLLLNYCLFEDWIRLTLDTMLAEQEEKV